MPPDRGLRRSRWGLRGHSPTSYPPKKAPLVREALRAGESCRPDLNRLMPWIDKMWALHPYFPDLVKDRDLQGAVLL